MTVPDKLSYTKGEKLAEIFCAAFAACIAAAMIVMTALQITDGGNIILLVVLLIINGVFSLCSVYPQHTNIFSKPERISEKGFRTTRRASDRRKAPIRGFSDGTSALRARFDGTPSNRTLARIEDFFASGSPRQKSDFKARIRGQI